MTQTSFEWKNANLFVFFPPAMSTFLCVDDISTTESYCHLHLQTVNASATL